MQTLDRITQDPAVMGGKNAIDIEALTKLRNGELA